MMAAAMATSTTTDSTYLDLARGGAQLSRDIDPAKFERLQAVAERIDTITAELQFGFVDKAAAGFDDDGPARVVVTGDVSASCEVTCQRCSEPLSLNISAPLQVVVVHSEAIASNDAALAQYVEHSGATIVVCAEQFDAVELLEDELLLQLPWRPCTDDACANLPSYSYAANTSASAKGQKRSDSSDSIDQRQTSLLATDQQVNADQQADEQADEQIEQGQRDAGKQETHRPFAGLRELLEASSHGEG